MKLDCIITLANERVRLRFLAMERSLRATGCKLPLRVIPFDESLFQLPENSIWWEIPDLISWLTKHKARPFMRKYQCLLTENFQFVDSDVIFVKNPEEVLLPHHGFITSCGHWHNPGHTVTEESRNIMADKSTTWQKSVFNTGQFACDTQLYSLEGLMKSAEAPEFRSTCLFNRFHEQMGLNLLVFHSGIPVTNVTLPPWNMESTWFGDYDQDFQKYWTDTGKKPYLIHFAGQDPTISRPIDELFFKFLSREEKLEWTQEVRRRQVQKGINLLWPKNLARAIVTFVQGLLRR